MYRTRLVLLAVLAGLTAETAEPNAGKTDWLVNQLGSDNFREREAASKRLEEIGEPALGALRKAARSGDAEISRRAAAVIEAIASRDSSRAREALQGLWVLKTTEYLGEKANQDPTDECEIEKLWSYRTRLAEERGVPEDLTKYRTTLEFKGTTFEERYWLIPFNTNQGFIVSRKGTYHLDVHRGPKALERRWVKSFGNTDEPGASYSVYRVRGDTLQLCINFACDPKDLPTTFTTENEKDLILFTYKRQKR